MRLGGDARPQAQGRAQQDTNSIEIIPGVRTSFLTLGVTLFGFFAIGFVLYGFGSVEITEYALRSDLLTRKVEKKTYGSGRYWIGPFSEFIRFPAVLRTIQFSDSRMQNDLSADEPNNPMLRSRTADGLDVSIELSFQYQLTAPKVFDLYTTLGKGSDFHSVFVRIAIDRLTETATRYTANEFFVERTIIGREMENILKTTFDERLFSTIYSFQLRAVTLPDEFETAIQTTEVKKQDVKVASAEQNTTRVSLDTLLMQAKRRVKVRSNDAEAFAQSVILENTADIEQYTKSQEMAADSYSGIEHALDDKENSLLAYVESRVLRDHPSSKSTVGLNMPELDFNSM